MRRFRLCVVFVALMVSVAVPASALLSCMADQTASAMAKMACCKTAKPECGTASKGTMECCKAGTHSDQQTVAKELTVANPLKTAFLCDVSTPVPQPILARQPQAPVMLCAGTTSPPRFAFSALLI
jgi:hypothetical protein